MIDPRRTTHPSLPPPLSRSIRNTQRATRELQVVAPQLRLEPGTLIEGSYRILRLLGEGGMGVVMHAIDERLERDVAIKLIHPDRIGSPAVRDQLRREARTMAHVRHPNLVEIYACGQLGDSPYLVMEYVPGQDLESWLESRREVISIDEALGVLDQLCRGVTAMHAAGAVHRDLKPGNVLVGPGFRIAVTDLGLARRIDDVVREESISGTPAYLAPEVAAQLPVPPGLAHAVDVYALGIMAFELLTGQLPFWATDAATMLELHVNQPPPRASALRPELPERFDEILAQALAKDPAQRTPSVESFRRELLDARDALARSSGALRVLVADDDDDCRAWTARFIESAFAGAIVERASDGHAALQLALRRPPDVAIVDLSMPRLNGVELTAALRANRNTSATPILVMTGVGGAPDWQLLHRLGASGFLVKPFDPDSLIATIRRVTAMGAVASTVADRG